MLLSPIYSCIHLQVWFYFTWSCLFYTEGIFGWDTNNTQNLLIIMTSLLVAMHVSGYCIATWCFKVANELCSCGLKDFSNEQTLSEAADEGCTSKTVAVQHSKSDSFYLKYLNAWIIVQYFRKTCRKFFIRSIKNGLWI